MHGPALETAELLERVHVDATKAVVAKPRDPGFLRSRKARKATGKLARGSIEGFFCDAEATGVIHGAPAVNRGAPLSSGAVK